MGANNTVISTTIFKYFISALTLNWYADDNERADTLKSLNSNLINCKKELFNFKFLMPEKDEIKAAFIKDVQSDTPTSLAFMTEFVLYCIDENKCRQMVDELLRAIRDDKDIADDTEFYILGNGKSTTKEEWSINSLTLPPTVFCWEYGIFLSASVRKVTALAVIHLLTGTALQLRHMEKAK